MKNIESKKSVLATLTGMNIVLVSLAQVLTSEQKIAMGAILMGQIDQLRKLPNLSAENLEEIQETIRDIQDHIEMLSH